MKRVKYKSKSNINFSGILKSIIALTTSTVLIAAGTCCLGFASRSAEGKWFGNFKNIASWHWQDEAPSEGKEEGNVVAVNSNGEKMYAGQSYAMTEEITFVGEPAQAQGATSKKASRYSAMADEVITQEKIDNAFYITPTLSNEYITNAEYDWSLAYGEVGPDQNTSVPIEQAIRIVPIAEPGQQEAQILYYGQFNAPIILTVTLRGTNKTATCKFNSLKKITMGISMCCDTIGDDICEVEMLSHIPEKGVIIGDMYIKSFNFKYNDDFKTAVQSKLKFNIAFQSYEITAGGIGELIDKDLLLTIFSCYMSFCLKGGAGIKYEDIISSFQTYDENQQTAIKYALKKTWDEFRSCNADTGTLYVSFNYFYKGVKIYSLNYDKTGFLMDSTYNINTAPISILLNSNYIVG